MTVHAYRKAATMGTDYEKALGLVKIDPLDGMLPNEASIELSVSHPALAGLTAGDWCKLWMASALSDGVRLYFLDRDEDRTGIVSRLGETAKDWGDFVLLPW